MKKKIVVIGGGTGVFTVLSGLKNYSTDLAAVVNMSDDGGSTGILREEFGILPPGDIRRALVALSRSDNKILSDLFNFRFNKGAGLTGHNFGNLMITALERITGDFASAIHEASKILSVDGRVIPVTLNNSKLYASLEDGTLIKGETNIDIPNHDGRLKIKKVWLRPGAQINPKAKKAILDARAVIIGPGDLFTSIMPNLLVAGMKEALRASKAKKIYIVNLMTKFGETNGFSAEDFIKVISDAIGGESLDYVIINNKMPSLARLKKYAEEKSLLISHGDLPPKPTPIVGDFLRNRELIRHDPDKLAKTILSLI
ncbi:MAG: YvcK family protein [Candidatus Liptonbacteria bacterium]|nr:YvcK family protein [Candidatus Liptonbacteria bacterium]